MSQDDSLKSNSESSGSSTSNQLPFYQEHVPTDHLDSNITDLTLYGSPAPTLTRSGTVKRVMTTNFQQKKDANNFSVSEDDSVFIRDNKSSSDSIKSRYRRSLDSTLRRSLESISEHKTKQCFSPTRTLSTTSRCSSSLESFCSEPDNAIRSSTKNEGAKTVQSPASSYLSWIESVSNEFIAVPVEARKPIDTTNEVDNKVGEWNNFWLNYNSARSRYMSSAFISSDDRIVDDLSETKSSKEISERAFVLLTLDEVKEALRCSKKITDIFQSALNRNDHDCDNSNLESSYYSESVSRQNNSLKEEINGSIFTSEDLRKVSRERSASYIINTQDFMKQKEILKPAIQSSSTSCINAILNTGVADILKRVINKRRDIMTPDDMSSVTRRSFSEWSNK